VLEAPEVALIIMPVLMEVMMTLPVLVLVRLNEAQRRMIGTDLEVLGDCFITVRSNEE
jgi:hypothetical protein